MNLEFDEAITNHRKMWNWIADETEIRETIVEQEDYFAENNLNKITCNSFCCQYACEYSESFDACGKKIRDCRMCPIEWGVPTDGYCGVQCIADETEFDSWSMTQDLELSAKYARQIANLPAREEVRGR